MREAALADVARVFSPAVAQGLAEAMARLDHKICSGPAGTMVFLRKDAARPQAMFVLSSILEPAAGDAATLHFIRQCWTDLFADDGVAEIVAEIPRTNRRTLNYALKRMPGAVVERETSAGWVVCWRREEWHAVSRR